MIFERIRRGSEFPRTFGVKASIVYRGVSTLPEGTMLGDGELLRKLSRLLVKRILYIYSLYRSRTTVRRLSFLEPLYPSTESLEETSIQCFSARILDDLAVCYLRAWFNINSAPTRVKREVFDYSKIREKRLRRFFLEEAERREFDVLEQRLGLYHSKYLLGLRGLADFVSADPPLVIEFCLTPIYFIDHMLPRVSAYALAYRLMYGCCPLTLIVSSHNLAVAVVDYSEFNYEKVFRELSWLSKADIKYVEPTSTKHCSSCIYRLRCPKRKS